MRRNLPITSREVEMPVGVPIVTTTDLDGRITTANEPFVAISGFERGEIIGAAHTLVRHPDMPAEAFADLWRDLKAGRHWCGLVKNRCKNGDFYWVRANVYPLKGADGRPAGYISVRVAPDRWDIAATERAYRRFQDGTAGSLAILHGEVVDSSPRGRLAATLLGTVTGRIGLALAALAAAPVVTAIASVILLPAASPAALPLLAGSLAATLAALVAAGLLLAPVAGGVGRIRAALDSLYRDGDLRVRAEVTGGGDVAAMAATFNHMVSDLAAVVADIARVSEGFAEGDLTQRVNAHAVGDMNALKIAINRSIERMGGTLSTVMYNIRQVAAASNQTSTAVSQIADGAISQLNAVRQMANGVEQTADAVAEVSSAAQRTSAQARQAAETVAEGRTSIGHMVGLVNAIADNARQVGKVTEVIGRIAKRTNMLSLNAAIEAARAGEAGKGFAVVAEQVGKLADLSGRSASDINALIERADIEARRGVDMAKVVGDSMERIARGANDSEHMAMTIAAAVEQQAAALEEIRTIALDLSRIGESNAAAAEQVTSTMLELSRLADHTRAEVERFRF